MFMSLILKATELPPSYTLVEAAPLHGRGIQVIVRNPEKAITISDLPPGLYDIRLAKGWSPEKRQREVRLTTGKTTELDW